MGVASEDVGSLVGYAMRTMVTPGCSFAYRTAGARLWYAQSTLQFMYNYERRSWER